MENTFAVVRKRRKDTAGTAGISNGNDRTDSRRTNKKKESKSKNISTSQQKSQDNGGGKNTITELSKSIKPETPLGWITLLSSITSAILMHETRLQKKLTQPPLVYSQNTPTMNILRQLLSQNPKSKDGKGILTREIKPSLLVGTRSFISSTAAYALHGPPKEQHLHFREIMTMGDGATIALDWVVPYPKYNSSVDIRLSDKQLEADVLYGPIDLPVVIIMHGINNDTGFGYMKSLMKSCADRGWIACGMNFRGCGGVKLTTPRGYNAAYTGDLRSLVRKVAMRMRNNVPIFLVGNSLGANILTKYLGEEGFSKTLPSCVAGGISLGNPLHINSCNVAFPFNVLLAAGVKKSYLQSRGPLSEMSNCIHFGSAIRRAWLSRTIGQLDDAMSPFLIRNDTTYPFHPRLGYVDGEDYWHDASSNRYIQHVTVPLLKLSAQDDFLVVHPALQSLSRCLENPNVLVVKTKCGGHLGWQEAPRHGFGVGKSWADSAVCDFIEAVLEMRSKVKKDDFSRANQNGADVVESMYASKHLQSKL